MATFGEVLEHFKKGQPFAQRSIVKNKTIIQEYKGRLYHNVMGVRASYKPSDKDLFATDWELIK